MCSFMCNEKDDNKNVSNCKIQQQRYVELASTGSHISCTECVPNKKPHDTFQSEVINELLAARKRSQRASSNSELSVWKM